jgi:hypothetical protein
MRAQRGRRGRRRARAGPGARPLGGARPEPSERGSERRGLFSRASSTRFPRPLTCLQTQCASTDSARRSIAALTLAGLARMAFASGRRCAPGPGPCGGASRESCAPRACAPFADPRRPVSAPRRRSSRPSGSRGARFIAVYGSLSGATCSVCSWRSLAPTTALAAKVAPCRACAPCSCSAGPDACAESLSFASCFIASALRALCAQAVGKLRVQERKGNAARREAAARSPTRVLVPGSAQAALSPAAAFERLNFSSGTRSGERGWILARLAVALAFAF